MCLIPGQGTYLGCRFCRGVQKATSQCFSITSMFLSLFLSVYPSLKSTSLSLGEDKKENYKTAIQLKKETKIMHCFINQRLPLLISQYTPHQFFLFSQFLFVSPSGYQKIYVCIAHFLMCYMLLINVSLLTALYSFEGADALWFPSLLPCVEHWISYPQL